MSWIYCLKKTVWIYTEEKLSQEWFTWILKETWCLTHPMLYKYIVIYLINILVTKKLLNLTPLFSLINFPFFFFNISPILLFPLLVYFHFLSISLFSIKFCPDALFFPFILWLYSSALTGMEAELAMRKDNYSLKIRYNISLIQWSWCLVCVLFPRFSSITDFYKNPNQENKTKQPPELNRKPQTKNLFNTEKVVSKTTQSFFHNI